MNVVPLFPERQEQKLGFSGLTVLHGAEPLEALIKKMLMETYAAGFQAGETSSHPTWTQMEQSFLNFYISYIDQDNLAHTKDNRPSSLPDCYNTLLDLIAKREQSRWFSGFREACGGADLVLI